MWMDSCGQNEFYKNKTNEIKNFFFFFFLHVYENNSSSPQKKTKH